MLLTPTRLVRARGATWMAWLMLAGGLAQAAEVEPVVVTVPANVVGRTPQLIGYNFQGVENLPGSGTSFWLEYTGMTAARLWWPLETWPDDPKRWPEAQATLARFEQARAELRRDPRAVDWSAHERRIAEHFGGVFAGMPGHAYAFAEAHRLGIKVLSPLTVGPWNTLSGKRFPFDRADGTPDWSGRWAYWRGIYLNVYYLARHYDVERYQLFNEPDHPNSMPMTQAEFITRLQIGADAIRAAVDDVNRDHGKALVARVSAPVTAGLEVYRARSGRKDTRDTERGWGEVTLAALDADFPGRSEPKRPLFDHYAFQNYTRDPQTIAERGARVLEAMRADRPQGHPPLIVTETNVSTAANFLRTTETLDTPDYYAPFGAIAIGYTLLGVEEFYVFRLTQTDNMPGGAVKKNGTHVVDNRDPLKRILRSTKGGEAARLFIRTLDGGLERMAQPAALPPGLTLLAARPASGGARVLIANTGAARRLRLKLAEWNLPPGAAWLAEEVSARAHGAITQFGRVAADGSVDLELPARSNVGLRIGLSGGDPEFAALAARADRWPLAGLPPRAQYLGFHSPAAADARIVRAWLETQDGKRRRLLGHVVIGGNGGEQWLELRPEEIAAGLWVRVEPDLPGEPAVPAASLSLRGRL